MNTALRVAAFVAGLGALFAAAVGVGSAVGPIGGPVAAHADMGQAGHETSGHETSGHETSGHDEVSVPGGVMTSQGGYTLALDTTELAAGDRRVSFVIEDSAGEPLTSYDVVHEKRLHLIVVRRDFAGFQHVHPVLSGTGTWTAPVHLGPGSWRVLADFTPAGEEGLTLGADLAVPGTVPATATSPTSRTSRIGDYRVTLTGELVPGADSTLDLSVTRGGQPVTDLQPYLGAYGHLVALREGDLAYLHVHPENGSPGPDVAFGAEVPSAGRYHLYLDYKHDGVVRTASFVLGTQQAEKQGKEDRHDHHH